MEFMKQLKGEKTKKQDKKDEKPSPKVTSSASISQPLTEKETLISHKEDEQKRKEQEQKRKEREEAKRQREQEKQKAEREKMKEFEELRKRVLTIEKTLQEQVNLIETLRLTSQQTPTTTINIDFDKLWNVVEAYGAHHKYYGALVRRVKSGRIKSYLKPLIEIITENYEKIKKA
jgi:seryl-tRNA synthetase